MGDFGCLAFLLEAGGKTLLYSGDLRRHGRKPGMIRTLIERVAPRNVDVLLMEGTHLGGEKEQGTTEFELEERVVELVKTAPACPHSTDSNRRHRCSSSRTTPHGLSILAAGRGQPDWRLLTTRLVNCSTIWVSINLLPCGRMLDPS